MDVDRLAVHLYEHHVADLVDSGDGLCAIQYTAGALTLGAPARLSLSLPVSDELYPATGGAHRWARALLPEGRAMDALVAQTGVPGDDVFALLSVVGRDVAGAAVIVRPDEDPTLPDARYEPLDDDQLEALVLGVDEHPLGLDVERGVRLSLAGLQDKLLLHRPPRSRSLHRPLNGAPSTLIVKPEPIPPEGGRSLAGLVTNELFGLLLARAARLPAASARAETIAGHPCLVVERYDRQRGSPPVRIHQEDLLMAMGRDHRLKYEDPNPVRVPVGGGFADRQAVRTQPGPSLAELAAFLRGHVGTGGQLRLLEAATFNVAYGNADAHARNYSLLLPPDGHVRLAPLYDTICTRAYPHLGASAAQRVGGVEGIDEIRRDHLVVEGSSWGLPEAVVADAVDRTLARMEASLERVGRQTSRGGGDDAVIGDLTALVGGRIASIRS